ncbi:hypothetical protein Aperf_G00000122267 [Anoplocephala perfoliata]
MHGLPPTNPLSLANTHIARTNLIPESTDSKSAELPPIYGEKVDINWIESHNRLIGKLSEVREQLSEYANSSLKVEERSVEKPPIEEIPYVFEALRQSVESVRSFAQQMHDIEEAYKFIEQASGRLTSATVNEEAPELGPLSIIQEVLESVVPPDVQRIEAYRKFAEEAMLKSGLRPIRYHEFYMTRERAEMFYAAHQGRFFYDRLVTYMISGPIGVYVLAGESAVFRWRELIGPTKVYKCVLSHPNSLRGRFGLTDTRNGFHGSDCDENAEDEIKFFFPSFDFEDEEITRALNSV